MTERVLSVRELNRALLARQLLLQRHRLPLQRALERVAGLQTQYAPTGYIGLWSRLQGFERRALTRALERRAVVQGTLMRTTIHMVSARDYWLFALGVRRERREWWLRQHKEAASEADLQAHADRLRAALAEGPRRESELGELASGFLGHVGLWLDLVRAPPSGTWERRRADILAAAEDWIGPTQVSEEDGLDHLLRRYLGGFGPARLKDAADWAGVRVTTLRPAVDHLKLRRFRDEEGRELIDLPRAPLPPPDSPAPPRFLGVWEAALLVHARRTRILPEEFRPLVFNIKTPHSVNTFLVDGAVAGRWRVERAKTAATLVLEPFEPIPRRFRRELAHEGERLVRFLEPAADRYAVRQR